MVIVRAFCNVFVKDAPGQQTKGRIRKRVAVLLLGSSPSARNLAVDVCNKASLVSMYDGEEYKSKQPM